MDVVFYDHDSDLDLDEISEVETKNIPISEIEPLIELVRKYGYMDLNGRTYEYERAQVEPEGTYIYLKRKYKEK